MWWQTDSKENAFELRRPSRNTIEMFASENSGIGGVAHVLIDASDESLMGDRTSRNSEDSADALSIPDKVEFVGSDEFVLILRLNRKTQKALSLTKASDMRGTRFQTLVIVN